MFFKASTTTFSDNIHHTIQYLENHSGCISSYFEDINSKDIQGLLDFFFGCPFFNTCF